MTDGRTTGQRVWRGRKDRRRNAHFMDVAYDGYVRDLALQAWRGMQRRRATGDPVAGALQAEGERLGRGDYAGLWQRHWAPLVRQGEALQGGALLEAIEAAVRGALDAERLERERRGDADLEDTPGYREFVGRAMGRLLEEAAGEIEEV